MIQTIEEAIEWIHSRMPFGLRPGLTRVQGLLDHIGNPEKNLTIIHVAGTNGKGSTVTCLRYMLEELGLVVGTFTSPYIERFNERISINGEPISDDYLLGYVNNYQDIVEKLDKQPKLTGITEFELITAIAMNYFSDLSVDVAIIEVGLGGLLDSTNIVSPILTAITTIGKDHTIILGDTLEAIAEQKAGIIKKEVPVVTGNIDERALQVIEKIAEKKDAPIYRYGKEYHVDYLHPDINWGEVFHFSDQFGKINRLKVSLLGQYQAENAGVAVELFLLYCDRYKITNWSKAIKNGLKKAKWPARMEKISTEPMIVLDGAHNLHAIDRLADTLKTEFSNKEIYVLFSTLTDKDTREMLHALKKIPSMSIYLTTFDYPNAIDVSEFQDMVGTNLKIVPQWELALAEIVEQMDSEDLLLVTGSLYFVSQVRQLLMTVGGEK